MSALSPHQFTADQIEVGDRLDRTGKTRVAALHPDKSKRVLARTQTTGARSPSVKKWGPDEQVTVWRRSK
jgi:hypothetical protein